MSIRGILHTLSLTFIKVRNQKKDDPKILDILILYSDDAQHQIISKYPDKKIAGSSSKVPTEFNLSNIDQN